jgi:hypothetical protein
MYRYCKEFMAYDFTREESSQQQLSRAFPYDLLIIREKGEQDSNQRGRQRRRRGKRRLTVHLEAEATAW